MLMAIGGHSCYLQWSADVSSTATLAVVAYLVGDGVLGRGCQWGNAGGRVPAVRVPCIRGLGGRCWQAADAAGTSLINAVGGTRELAKQHGTLQAPGVGQE